MEIQVLEERYVDIAKLVALLETLFGKGNFEIELQVNSPSVLILLYAVAAAGSILIPRAQDRADQVLLVVPRQLTEVGVALLISSFTTMVRNSFLFGRKNKNAFAATGQRLHDLCYSTAIWMLI